ncbi:MAG TPA: monovalent cation/H(+) antiporter subunit G [Alphaproteobacteria bacterium]|nr:monovalent cation/H(+) antiporter subunit G [Alphaproteobacteria bacterium]
MILADVMRLVAAVLVVAGSAFSFLAAVGMLRLPDLYTRMHAASKAGVVGAGLVLLAVALVAGDLAVGLRAILGIGFLLLTTPVSAHLLARAALRAAVKPSPITSINELETGEQR